MFLSPVYNPSATRWSNNTDLSLVYRSIEVDVATSVSFTFLSAGKLFSPLANDH